MAAVDDITAGLAALAAVGPAAEKYRNYYEGRHSLAALIGKFRQAFGSALSPSALNYCAPVVNARTRYMHLDGFDVMPGSLGVDGDADDDDELPEGADDDVQRAIRRVMRASKFVTNEAEAYTELGVTAALHAIVWPDPVTKVPVIHWNPTASVHVEYDPEFPTRKLWAFKLWQAGQVWRANIYYPDRIERYASKGRSLPSKGTGFVPFDPDGTGATLPNPFGVVPVARCSIPYSVLRDAVGVQDSLNKSAGDLILSSEYFGKPQRWKTGATQQVDPVTGLPKKSNSATPGAMLVEPNKEARFGQFDAADLKQLVMLADSFKADMARTTETPLHLLSLEDGVSLETGEAIRNAERPLLAWVERWQEAAGEFWCEAFELALHMQGFDVELTARWRPTVTLDPMEEDQTAQYKATAAQIMVSSLGFSKRYVQRKIYGLSDEEIDDMAAECDDEQAQANADAGAAMMRAFNAGRVAPGQSPLPAMVPPAKEPAPADKAS